MQTKAHAYFDVIISLCQLAAWGSLSGPVFCTNIASGVCWDSAAVDDYRENHEAYASSDLHDTEDEFDLLRLTLVLERVSVSSPRHSPHAKDLDGNQSDKQRYDPSTVVDALRSGPVVDDVASS